MALASFVATLLGRRVRAHASSCNDSDIRVAMHVALFEAVNPIARKFEPYTHPLVTIRFFWTLTR